MTRLVQYLSLSRAHQSFLGGRLQRLYCRWRWLASRAYDLPGLRIGNLGAVVYRCCWPCQLCRLYVALVIKQTLWIQLLFLVRESCQKRLLFLHLNQTMKHLPHVFFVFGLWWCSSAVIAWRNWCWLQWWLAWGTLLIFPGDSTLDTDIARHRYQCMHRIISSDFVLHLIWHEICLVFR